nr:hypothetical protein [Tanacetum cinerariifolium]
MGRLIGQRSSTEGLEVIDSVLDVVRKEAENYNMLQGRGKFLSLLWNISERTITRHSWKLY